MLQKSCLIISTAILSLAGACKQSQPASETKTKPSATVDLTAKAAEDSGKAPAAIGVADTAAAAKPSAAAPTPAKLPSKGMYRMIDPIDGGEGYAYIIEIQGPETAPKVFWWTEGDANSITQLELSAGAPGALQTNGTCYADDGSVVKDVVLITALPNGNILYHPKAPLNEAGGKCQYTPGTGLTFGEYERFKL
ncbi:MAG: hypothetical protein IPL79_06255 [Myxococcales bacterium]|nr:hypothetical protein [Myxococcales bacterium]